MIPKFKLGIENDLGISYKWYGVGVERSKVKVRVRVNSNTAWVRTLSVPSSSFTSLSSFSVPFLLDLRISIHQ